MTFARRFEFATDQDPSLNYCLWRYPPAAPAEDKFRSVNLLYQSFDCAGIDPRAGAVVDAIIDGIGPFRTVFGVKLVGDRLAWELYFYDYQRRRRLVSMSRVLQAIRSCAPCAIVPNESLPYFMFSLDLDDALVTGERALDVIHMYVGNAGSTVSSGIAYAVRAGSTTLENFYFFFDAGSQRSEVSKKIATSAHFDDTTLSIDTVMVPELRECRTICVANKQTHDCIYFSGVTVDQLIWFLNRLRYPQDIQAFVQDNRHNLDHLLFDVGFDYRQRGHELEVLKSGYYGVF